MCVAIIILGLYFNTYIDEDKIFWISILPITASVSLVILTYYIKSTQNMRIVLLFCTMQWALFDFHFKAYPMFTMDIITLTTTTLEYLRRKNKNIADVS
ncbi:MAG: YgjV family protein [Bdellovibrionota bacterium]